jgi:hypothetical protein
MRETVATFRNAGPLPRADNDWYVEPAEAVEALLRAERFSGRSYDPACGLGTIPAVFKSAGLECHGSDLVDRSSFWPKRDFLADGCLWWGVANIVSNPPFNLARAFVDKALTVASHKVAMLLPLTFLEGQRKAPWLKSTPLARVHIFAWRISMPPGELLVAGKVKPEGGKKCFAWFVWEHGHFGPPAINLLERPVGKGATL